MITWVTKAPAPALLSGVADRVLTISPEDLLKLSALEFDVGLVSIKVQAAVGVLARTKVTRAFGFAVDARSGGIVPATPAADELWRLGLDDHRKFSSIRKRTTTDARSARTR